MSGQDQARGVVTNEQQMSSNRRYTEKEIAEIFRQAADEEKSRRNASASGGLTLEEIQQIGQEVGLAPELIGKAAAAVDRKSTTPPPAKMFGIPVSVGRTVDLPGAFSDEDWDLLVADLHATFHKPGKIQVNGANRSWSIGNLNFMVEPTPTGHRIRARTENALLRSQLTMGAAFLLMGLFFGAVLLAKGGVALDKVLFVSMFPLVGMGIGGYSMFKLPRWRQEREQQMEAILERATERAGVESTGDVGAAEVGMVGVGEEVSGRLGLDLDEDPAYDEPAKHTERGREKE